MKPVTENTARKVRRYRFANGAFLATGPRPTAIPPWAPSQMRVDVSRDEAARALWGARHNAKRMAGF